MVHIYKFWDKNRISAQNQEQNMIFSFSSRKRDYSLMWPLTRRWPLDAKLTSQPLRYAGFLGYLLEE